MNSKFIDLDSYFKVGNLVKLIAKSSREVMTQFGVVMSISTHAAIYPPQEPCNDYKVKEIPS